MRKLYVRNQDSTNKGATVVRDDHNNACYLLVGKWGIRHDALSVYSIDGHVLAEIKQTSVGIFPKFDLFFNGQKIGSISKTFGLIHEFMYIKKLKWFITGNLRTGLHHVYSGRQLVMTVTPVFLYGAGYSELTIKQQATEPVCICVAAILDHWAKGKPKAPLKNKASLPGWRLSNGETSFNNIHEHPSDKNKLTE
ncbi:LURP-one-related/scramblase family protein [Pediococcus siamensis]|uniref:LURP-one-related/scramblase family protein n=1 Tax=Pediococcus siamensis TaxID=381829 RepID=UPI0039A07C47